MNGITRTVATTFLTCVACCACWAQVETSNSPRLSEERLDVYRGFLNKFAFLHVKNLSRTTVPLDFAGVPDGRPCLAGIELEKSRASESTHVFTTEITNGRDLELVDPSEQKQLLQKSLSQNQPEQGTQLDKGLGFFILSEIAFDAKHQFAVLKYLLICGEHCGSGATLVMEKVNGQWTASPRRPCAIFAN